MNEPTQINEEAKNLLRFWFEELEPKDWFKKSDELDRQIKLRFGESLVRARACELSAWRTSARGRLAEVILLDQFSRNIHRGQPEAFSADPLALALAQEAIALKADLELNSQEKSFLYMPFMHSESPLIHKVAVELFQKAGLANLDYELKHKDIIDRYGRYPHRNEILGRPSTEEELQFLKQKGSSF